MLVMIFILRDIESGDSAISMYAPVCLSNKIVLLEWNKNMYCGTFIPQQLARSL